MASWKIVSCILPQLAIQAISVNIVTIVSWDKNKYDVEWHSFFSKEIAAIHFDIQL